eukprot:TRINITY_DN778428_c0_g1_i1.p1 TRINITY_DN778428_c0_g1~~TRINITY_DN778428_c0_g1_i1.p1  ORF type:complete len:212 (-),score=38.96 TRINITY_DN778428_c0_g1_i1:88-723(-)
MSVVQKALPVDFTTTHGVKITIHNIVATAKVGCQLDCRRIATTAKNAEYNPKKFPGTVMRFRDLRTTVLCFSSGKLVINGAKSEHQALTTAKKAVAVFRKIGFKDARKLHMFTIQNIMATCDVRFPIRLEQLQEQTMEHSTYEPELHPGLQYRMIDPKVVLMIYVSGKIVFTGAKSRTAIYESFDKMYPVLLQFHQERLRERQKQNAIEDV